MKRLNIFIHTILVTLFIILGHWKGSATGYQPQETNKSRPLRVGDGKSPPQTSANDPEHEKNNYYDGESSVSSSPLQDYPTEEKRLGAKSQDNIGPESNGSRTFNEPMNVLHSPLSPSPQGVNRSDGIHAYRNSKSVFSFGDDPRPQGANSSDGGGIHTDNSNPETGSSSKDGSHVQLNTSSRDTIVRKLPNKLRTRIATTDHYDRKLLEGYVNVSKKLPNHIERNLRDYYRSRLMERMTLRKLIAKEKLGAAASRLIADYRAVRNGGVGDEVRLNPNFRSFFENASLERTAYENVKRSEVEPIIDEDLVDDSERSVDGTTGEEKVYDDDVRSGESKTAAGVKRITVEPVGQGDKTPGFVVRLVKRDADDEPSADNRRQAAKIYKYEGAKSEDVAVNDEEDEEDKGVRVEFKTNDTPDNRKQAGNAYNDENAKSGDVAVKDDEEEVVRVEFNAIDTPDDRNQESKIYKYEDVAVKDEMDKEARVEFNANDIPNDRKHEAKIYKYEGARSEDVAKDKVDKEARVEFNADDEPSADDRRQSAKVYKYEGAKSEDAAIKDEEDEEDKGVRVEFKTNDTPDNNYRKQSAKVYNHESARSEDVAVKDDEEEEVRVEFNAIDTPDNRKQAAKIYKYEGAKSEDAAAKDEDDEEVRVEFNANDTLDDAVTTSEAFTGSITEHATKSSSLILPLALIIGSIIELIIVTLFVCKDRIFGKKAKTAAPNSAVAPGKPGAPEAQGKPDATATTPHGAAKTVVTTTTTKKDTEQKAKK